MIVERSEEGNGMQQIMKQTSNIFFGINVAFLDIQISNSNQNHYTLHIGAIIKKNEQVSMNKHQKTVIKFLSNLLPTQSTFN